MTELQEKQASGEMRPKGLFQHGGGALSGIYLFWMCGLFPLFTGFRGYTDLTFSKYLFFVISTGVYILAIGVYTLRSGALSQPLLKKHDPRRYSALFMLWCVLSTLLSENRREAVIGNGRYDGLVTYLLLGLLFVCLCTYNIQNNFQILQLRRLPLCLAASTTLCCCIGLLQLFGLNPLWLFPGDLRFSDAGTRFTGIFLGTIGNVDVLSSLLCLVIPLCATQLLTGPGHKAASVFWSAALWMCVFTLFVSPVAGGLLSMAGTAMLMACTLIDSLERLSRALYTGGLAATAIAGALAMKASLADPANTKPAAIATGALHAAGSLRCLLCLALAVAAWVLARILWRIKKQPSAHALHRFFILLCVCAILGGVLFIYFLPVQTSDTADETGVSVNAIGELHEMLHGHIEDSYGSSRVRIWRQVLALVPQSPVFGGGPGTLSLRLDIQFSRYVEQTGQTLRTFVDNAHNVYLQLLADLGIPGLLLYLAMLASALYLHVCHQSPLTFALVGYILQDFFGLGLCLVSPLFFILLALWAPIPAPDANTCQSSGETVRCD